MRGVKTGVLLMIVASLGRIAIAQEPPGKAVYLRVCAVCHGADAMGKTGPALLPFEKEYLEVRGIVRDGRGEMPAVSPADVTDEELVQIVAYLKKLSEKGER
jgi:mono/diheme cytochrome c family protein